MDKAKHQERQLVRSESLHKHISGNLNFDWPDLAILFCAVVIASVGLAEENSPIIVGSMLISPLMSPLLGVGYGITRREFTMIKQGALLLGLQLMISLVASTGYFLVMQNATVNEAILSRTNITVGVAIVAFFGGLAAIIGSAKKDSGNILPGVAIAASLMPPLATVGFGLANASWDIALHAGELFFLNVGMIILGAALGTLPIVNRQRAEKRNDNHKWKSKGK